MTIFLSPDREPFYATTYLPKYSRPGMIGMMDLLPYISDIWKSRREEVNETGKKLIQAVKQVFTPTPADISEERNHDAYIYLAHQYDPEYGGFSTSPKFPSVTQILFLLRYYHHYSNNTAWSMAEHTLFKMAVSGIRDHLDGGFHRYATDRGWKLPHFEKMLYDQALLAIAYCEGYRISKNSLFKNTAEGILDYVILSLSDPRGAFYSSVDADSPKGEGAYYLWKQEEIMKILGNDDGRLFCTITGITPEGNVSGHGIPFGSNVLHPERDLHVALSEYGIASPGEWLARMQKKILSIRKERETPPIDDKILSDWNGLMISALVQGYITFRWTRYYQAAVHAATFILQNLIDERGRLLHSWFREKRGNPALSGDYIFLAKGLLDLFEADGDVKWLQSAIQLVQQVRSGFWDESDGGFYHSNSETTDLPVRLMDRMDGALPSVNGMASIVINRLFCLTGDITYSQLYDQLIRMAGGVSGQGSGVMLSFLSASIEKEKSFRILALFPDKSTEITDILTDIRTQYLPGAITVPINNPDDVSPIIQEVTQYPRKPAIYICGPGSCSPPVYSYHAYENWKKEVIRL